MIATQGLVAVDRAAYRAEFPIVEHTTFLNPCSNGAVSRWHRVLALGTAASCYDASKRPSSITTALDFPTIIYQWLAQSCCDVVSLSSDGGFRVPLERAA